MRLGFVSPERSVKARLFGLRALVTGTAFCLAMRMLTASRASGDWSDATTFSPSDQYVDAPQVAANDQGDMAISWSNQIDGYDSSVEVAVQPAGGALSQPMMVSDGQPGQNTEPSVAVGQDGTVAVVWSQNVRAGDEIRMSLGSISTGTFTPPITLDPPGSMPTVGPHYPHVSIDSEGGIFAVWFDGAADLDYASRAPGAASFGAVGTIASPDGYVFYPTVVSAPNGNVLADWEGRDGTYAVIRPAGGSFGTVQRVDPGCQFENFMPSAIDNSGDAIMLWTGSYNCNSGATPTWVKASYQPADGTFGAPETVATMGGWAQAGGVVMNAQGIPTVLCDGVMSSPVSNEGITALTRAYDGTWGSAQTVESTGGASNPPLSGALNDPPALVADAAGDLYAVWDSREWPADDTAESGVYASIRPVGGTFATTPTQLQYVYGQLDLAPRAGWVRDRRGRRLGHRHGGRVIRRPGFRLRPGRELGRHPAWRFRRRRATSSLEW